MEPVKISAKKLERIMESLKKGVEDSRGTYLFKEFRVQISKYKASGAERTSRLYHKRRDQGLCIRCGTKVTKKNPKTGKLYRLCDEHRDLIDKKAAEESISKAAGVKKSPKKAAPKKAASKKATLKKGVSKAGAVRKRSKK